MNEQKTETETPKATNPFAAAQNPFAAFADPMTAWTQAQAQFQKLMTESMTRAQAWSDEYVALESQMFTRANTAIDTFAQLAKDSIAYSAQLSAQARKLSVEATKRAGFGA